MIVRLSLVVLVMLNLSAAAWWLFHRDHAPTVATTTNAIPALKLVDATHAPSAATDAASPAMPADAICASFGPFADAAATEQARQQLRPRVVRVDARQVTQAGKVVFWLDVVAANGFDPAPAAAAVHAPHGERVSCPAASG